MSNNNTQRQLAENFSAQIDSFLSKLAGFSLEKRSSLMNRLHQWTITAAVLPLIMAAISASLVFLTKEALTSLTSLIDVVPPLFISRSKSNIDFFNKGLQLKYQLETLKGRINRLALVGKLEGDVLKEIEEELAKIKDFL